MRKTWSVPAVVLAIELLAVMHGLAQGTTFLSGLDRPTAGNISVGKYAWVATSFHTGDWPAGYTLNSIQLSMGPVSGSPSNFTVMVLDYLLTKPLTVLSGPSPSTEGVFSYAASGLILAPSERYLVAVTSATPVAEGSYRWNYTAANPVGVGYWRGENGYITSATGTYWGQRYVGTTPQFAVNATPIPEPTRLALLVAGGSLLAIRLRKVRPRP